MLILYLSKDAAHQSDIKDGIWKRQLFICIGDRVTNIVKVVFLEFEPRFRWG